MLYYLIIVPNIKGFIVILLSQILSGSIILFVTNISSLSTGLLTYYLESFICIFCTIYRVWYWDMIAPNIENFVVTILSGLWSYFVSNIESFVAILLHYIVQFKGILLYQISSGLCHIIVYCSTFILTSWDKKYIMVIKRDQI